jgi:adenylate kinase family enzyme
MIKEYIKEGKIVPMEVTIKLLENAMRDSMKEGSTSPSLFLVDGFPRQMDQAIEFDRTVSSTSLGFGWRLTHVGRSALGLWFSSLRALRKSCSSD